MTAFDVQDFQIDALIIVAGGDGAFSVDAFGCMTYVSAIGKAEFRRIWDEEPHRRHLFDEEPPTTWAAEEPTP